MTTTLTNALARCPLLAILRGVRPEEVADIGAALLDAGFVVLEVPLNSPDPFRSIEILADRFGDRALVGAGTVLDPADAARVAAAGGRLAVMPHGDAAVIRAARSASLAVLPGCFTPTEAFAALAAGADGLKLFPAESIPPAVIRAWRAVLPRDTLLIPTGGIGAHNLAAYLDAGVAGIGLGSALYKPGATARDVGDKARHMMQALDAARGVLSA
jgi:2-dehydro-3-deoxyphosphogalactonate aldolase